MIRLGIDVTRERSPDGPCADLCRHWYGEGYCTAQARHDGMCDLHIGSSDIKELVPTVSMPDMERHAGKRQAKPKAAKPKVKTPALAKTRAAPAKLSWPTDEREVAAMEYLGLDQFHAKLSDALRLWRAGERITTIRQSLGL